VIAIRIAIALKKTWSCVPAVERRASFEAAAVAMLLLLCIPESWGSSARGIALRPIDLRVSESRESAERRGDKPRRITGLTRRRLHRLLGVTSSHCPRINVREEFRTQFDLP
jgi:hypothetical protein